MIRLLEVVFYWFIGLLCFGSIIFYCKEWRKTRNRVKLGQAVLAIFVSVVVLGMAGMETYDRVTTNYIVETGECYVVDDRSSKGSSNVTLWFGERSYGFKEIPDVAYGPGHVFTCRATMTKQMQSGIDYELRSRDGELLYSTKLED
ncbi:hypothetical protein PTI97_06845 [Exiguobacterium marinum]|uniref:Uncharacterized protein n=1 Tax=Exiguobacterium marinum TaxID=273528 RepID=A0ABY7X290_9BACL|nr:hypothetical protein [Exiguobacterium marinum]WDH77228.1 hypothetical protein PTI97_06845 [Exiguobacterium marinum]